MKQNEEINAATISQYFIFFEGNLPNSKHSYFGLSRTASILNSQKLQSSLLN